ncbi:hypothetical protein EM4838_08225 [Enterococcus mundtii]|uniref:BppU N-terminal domain-containing protein n=1 Tax=Enterococcus mundtii TaxID=53346 RepID=A0ABQ0VGI0_ENTMU|nr:BppU family phage baseplate upper protein [Enterococcus mundtii]AUB52981.1 hypothetical protein EM4838_08225 [Enterococcus mundtii]OJG57015.1 hypothetical protein RV08_GL002250 [Enterococcus mundtii]GEL81812.1 hypothetical protein EMU01_29560 [Enterococcus mundtii]GEN20763.1 hypothetical protein LAC02_40440 [Ligilactobacillus acidipiscis]
MAEIQHKITLSTTESNNHIQLIKIRQGDVNTQKLVVEIVENGELKTFEGLVPFFINTTKFGENQPIEQKVQKYSPAQGRLEYTLSEPDWQWGGENTAHFSFRTLNGDGTWSEQFSTLDFSYRVVSGITNSCIRDSAYVWTFEELLRRFREYMEQGENEWAQWVQDNKDILESVDPGGTIIAILNDAKGDYASLAERLDSIEFESFDVPLDASQIQYGLVNRYFNSDTNQYEEVKPANADSVIESIDDTKFNMAFITDIHADAHVPTSEGDSWDNGETEFVSTRRWKAIGEFQKLGNLCDVMVYGGDNVDGRDSGITYTQEVPGNGQSNRYKTLKTVERFSKAVTVLQKKPVVICDGNHDRGGVPHNGKRTKLNMLSPADIAENYNGGYGGMIFEEKKIALYRLNTNDFTSQTDEDGFWLEAYGQGPSGSDKQGNFNKAQLVDFGQWLEGLDRTYHVILVGHFPLHDEEKVVGNKNHFQNLVDAFKQGTSISIDFTEWSSVDDSDITGEYTFDMSKKGVGTVVGYFCGHYHAFSIRQMGTTKIIIGNCSMSDEINTETETGFYKVEVDTELKKVTAKGVGRCEDYTFDY